MKALVITPTYNEAEGIADFLIAVLEADPRVDILIVDDQSPDGTGKIVQGMAQKNERIHCIVRDGKRGRGYADRCGMQWALDQGFEAMVQMDADFSHDPKYLTEMLNQLEEFDVVIGSRLISGGGIEGRNAYRDTVTVLANFYIKCVLGIKGVKDCTTGYRCYRQKVIQTLPLEQMFSPGPSLLEETLYSISRQGFSVKEVPIIFVDRKYGQSKLGFRELCQILFYILKIRSRNVVKKT